MIPTSEQTSRRLGAVRHNILRAGVPALIAVTALTVATSVPASAHAPRIHKPGAPTAVTAIALGGGAAVSWTAPASDGGSPITGYTVIASHGGATCTTTGATACTLTGLTNGHLYRIKVRASNAKGEGPASARVQVTPSLPTWPQFGLGPALTGFAASESTISAANVATLGLSFYSTLEGAQTSGSSPVVAGGRVYVTSLEGLLAFDAAGKTGCSGAPSSCDPLWRTSVLTRNTPAVGDSTVFATDGSLDAFDAAGQTGCTGGVCSPLWTGTVASGVHLTSPTISNGIVYVAGSGGSVYGGVVYAFDEAGQTNCSGTPKTCTPLWTAATGGEILSPPAVSNGVLYAGSSNSELYAFDATGQTNCSGTAKTCSPLWTANTDGSFSVAVSGGDVYVEGSDVNAFDASGQTNCSGTPKVCSTLWTAPLPGQGAGGIAVANGVLYASSSGTMVALDGAGQTNCSGTPKICTPLWSASVGGDFGPPSVGNQVVYAANSDGDIYAYDASGSTDCNGSPTLCSPLASFAADTGNGQVAVANGTLYAGYFGLFAYNLTGAHNFAPIVVVNPASSSHLVGNLTAAAIGDPEPTVQWYENGVPIPGANSDTYGYTVNPPGDNFFAQFTNTYGTVRSASASVSCPTYPYC